MGLKWLLNGLEAGEQMGTLSLDQAIVAAWRRHQEILLYLLEQIPTKGLAAVPTGSRGRDVAAQLHHLYRTRTGWLAYHATGKRPRLPRYDKNRPPTKA
jgi:hypothetical protein